MEVFVSPTRNRLTKRRLLLIVLAVLILLATSRADNVTSNASLQIANQNITIQLPAQIASNDILSGSITSFFSEYVGWGIATTKGTLLQMKSAYNLTGIYDIPFLGAIFVGCFLIWTGHIGTYLYMIENSLIFTFIGWIVLHLTLKAVLPGAIKKIPLINELMDAFLAGLFAIAIVSVL